MFFDILLVFLLVCFYLKFRKFEEETSNKIKVLFEKQKDIEFQYYEKEIDKFSMEDKKHDNQTEKIYFEEKEEFSNFYTVNTEENLCSEEIPISIKNELKIDYKNEDNKNSFEKVFMSDLFNKIGAIAIIIAIFIFLKFLSDIGIFTPLIKILTGFLAGISIIGLSLDFHKEKTKNYAEVLMGTGFGIMFITTYCGCSLLNIIPLWLGISIGILLVTACFFIAEKFKSFSTVAIGLVGGYINPFFVMSNISVNFLFGYFILLNIFSIVYIYKNTDKAVLNYINIIFTGISISYFAKNGNLELIYPILLWGVYLINDLMFIKNNKENYSLIKPLNYINYTVLIVFVCYIFKIDNNIPIGLSVLSAGIIYAICAFICSKSNKNEFYINGAILSVLISTYFLTDDILRICIYSFESLLLTMFLKRYVKENLYNWIYVYISAVLIFVCLQKGAFGDFYKNNLLYETKIYIETIINKLIIFCVPAIATLLSSKLIKNQDKNIADTTKIIGISFLYMFVISLCNTCIHSVGYTQNFAVKMLIYSAIASIYSINIQMMNQKIKYTFLKVLDIIVYYFAFILLFVGLIFSYTKSPIFIFNFETIPFIALFITTLCKNKYSKNLVYEYIAIILGLIYISYESSIFNNINLSVIWSIYSGIIMIYGILKNISTFKKCGIGIILITILKILIIDLYSVNVTYKILIFLALGLILMIVSYFYNKNQK